MIDATADPHYNVRNQVKPHASAWNVYKRLLGYSWRYKTRLVTALFFALIVASSFTVMVFGLGGTVSVLFDNEAEVAKTVDRYVHKAQGAIEKLPAPIQSLVPIDVASLNTRAVDKILQIRRDPRQIITTLLLISCVTIALALIGGAARFLQEYFAGTIGANISVTLGHEMYENVMRMSLRFFEQHPTGELLARFTNDIFMINRGLASVYVKLMREPVKGVFFLVAALTIDWRLTLLGLCVLPPTAYVIVRVGKRFKKSVRRSLEKVASMAMVVNETFGGIAIVKGFCMERRESERTSVELGKLRRYLVKMVKADALVGPLVEMVLILGLIAFVLISVRSVLIAKSLNGGQLVQLYLYLGLMLDPVRKLAAVNNLIQTSVASAERVFAFIDMQADITEAGQPIALPPLQRALEFDNVHFSYDGASEVLQGINLYIRKGEMIAIVGFSGAGKSTVARLVPRFYDVTAGAIRIDGVDIRQASFESLRGQIGIVTQETFLFNESVRWNIAFGRSDFAEDRIRQAARAAYADEFIERLPKGYDTVVGERGVSLSGGQRQRLAIARAIIKDPAILILDEATSSLDSESEQMIQQAIDEFVVGRTTIVIAHRLSTVQRADRIIVLEAGRIVEEGSHPQLLEKGGIYKRLYDVQFAAGEEPA